eukprot:gene17412-19155_t
MPTSAKRRYSYGPNHTQRPKLWTSQLCPYAQRATFALHYKGVDYESIEVDMKNKPAELLSINPAGQVPAMLDQGNAIYESNICVEYVDEVWESPTGVNILPADPASKAKARMWCDFIEKKIISPFFCMRKKECRQEATKSMLNGLAKVSEHLDTTNGPYFGGENIGIVDIAFAPFVNRMIIAEHFFNLKIPNTAQFRGFNVWWEAIQKHPSYIATKVEDLLLLNYAKDKLKSHCSTQKCS